MSAKIPASQLTSQTRPTDDKLDSNKRTLDEKYRVAVELGKVKNTGKRTFFNAYSIDTFKKVTLLNHFSEFFQKSNLVKVLMEVCQITRAGHIAL